MILVTRKDLTPGYQAVQPAHALAQFAISHPETFKEWQTIHKNLVILAVDTEEDLHRLWSDATLRGIECSSFCEPDIGNELTAIALSPGEETYRLTSSLPLALREEPASA